MLTNIGSLSLRTPNVFSVLRRWWQFSPILTSLTISMIATTLLGLIGILTDPRIVLNTPVWAKTTKFSISITLYTATFLWMLPMLTSRPRVARWIANGIGITLYIEMVVIIMQAFRGQAAHFNNATPFDAMLWAVMGVTINILWFIVLIGAVFLIRQKMADPALAWGIRLGAVIALIGMGLGFIMPMPTPDQLSLLESGQPSALIGAHTVGAPDGGPSLPLVGWSTTHGDLRIAHFIGLHGLQVLPIVGWWVGQRRERWLTDGYKVALVWASAAGYLGLTLLTVWQAMRGQPLLAPDALTLSIWATVVVAMVGAVGGITWTARQRLAV
jgi:hypothetical protein